MPNHRQQCDIKKGYYHFQQELRTQFVLSNSMLFEFMKFQYQHTQVNDSYIKCIA